MGSKTKRVSRLTREERKEMPDDKPASEMTDEELAEAIKPEETKEEVKAESDTPELEEAPAEPVKEEVIPEEEPEAPEEKPPSRREQLRIQQLLQKYGDPGQRQAPQQRRDVLDYNKALEAEPEVIQQLEADRKRAEDTQYEQGRSDSSQELQYMQFYNNIRFDLPLVTEKLSKLDPVDAKALDDEYLAITGADPAKGYVRNPNIGYAEFVEARIEQAERLASSMTAQTTKNIAKQAAQTGLRPDGSQAKRLNLNQAPENMTLEELYASIGQKAPKQ